MDLGLPTKSNIKMPSKKGKVFAGTQLHATIFRGREAAMKAARGRRSRPFVPFGFTKGPHDTNSISNFRSSSAL